MTQKGSRRIFLVTIEQLRAARALIGWSQSKLAEEAGVSLPTVKRVETGVGPRVSDRTRWKLQEALEAAGILFLEEDGQGVGVRFRKPQKRAAGS